MYYSYFDINPFWKKLEQQARKNKIGLWSDPQPPIAPWDCAELKKKENSFDNVLQIGEGVAFSTNVE
ncbi:MAG TPA: hypothetical protein PK110_02125 [Niabella sp.]|nr:hypothetical protein [Niabella sp.]